MNISEYLMSQRNADDSDVSFPVADRIKCKDGFSISVQATHSAYCSPRTNIGPWESVECGFPSSTPEQIMQYAEDPDHPEETVYGYVPIEKVEELLASHGGIVEVTK
jgi:hypothetical protein